MKQSDTSMDWNHAHAGNYEHTIALKIPGYHLLYDMMDRLLTAQLSQNGEEAAHILVVGAGGGQELSTLGTHHKHWSFTGVDPSAPMVLAARERAEQAGLLDRVALVHGEIDRLVPASRYSAATCLLVLHFVKGREQKLKLLQSIAERLDTGSPLFIAAINGKLGTEAFSIQLLAWKSHMLDNGISLPDWEKFVSSLGAESDPIPAADLEAMLEEAGFEQVTRFFGTYLIDGMFAVKRGRALL
ncbi:class I SAM-dependent methyltransferase [Paenibacillus sinopodophylli]|uniref:class I SAM-dependent methyltransferase n=1 Tax=Paenibacillus sinopodophylli TaxID=1837342 RepID=UPI00110CBC0A|nr:class I SAM-dependent methyltransferase [Paenibacillus sinopodophylli]